MEGGATVASFCSTEVEPMYKESDHIHIIGKMNGQKRVKIHISIYSQA